LLNRNLSRSKLPCLGFNMQWYVFALIAALLLAGADITRKRILFREASKEYLLVFVVLTALACSFYAPWATFDISLKSAALILLVGTIAATAQHYIFESIKHFELSTFLPLTNLQPLIVLALSITFLNEQISALQFIGIGLVLTGGYALEVRSHLHLSHPINLLRKSKFQRHMFAGIILIGIAIFFDKVALSSLQADNVPYPHFTFAVLVWWVIAALILLVYHKKVPVKRTFQKVFKKEGFLMFLPSICMAAFLATYYHAASLYFISLVIPLVRLNTLFAVTLGGRLFHEKHLFFKSFACCIMILGTFFIVQ